MKIAIVGAGAIGGYLGAKLAAAGEEVTFIARGANLDAIRQQGMKLIEEDGAGCRAADRKGAPGCCGRAGAGNAVAWANQRRNRAERYPVVVFPEARRRI